MKNLKILIVTGFNDEQKYSIEAEEAHKAYYLFLNPESRGVFSNGLAIKGNQISQIIPDWHGTMGWNRTHKLDTYDWEDINNKGLDLAMSEMLGKAKEIAYLAPSNPQLLNTPLNQIETKKNDIPLVAGMIDELSNRLKI